MFEFRFSFFHRIMNFFYFKFLHDSSRHLNRNAMTANFDWSSKAAKFDAFSWKTELILTIIIICMYSKKKNVQIDYNNQKSCKWINHRNQNFFFSFDVMITDEIILLLSFFEFLFFNHSNFFQSIFFVFLFFFQTFVDRLNFFFVVVLIC